MEKSKKNKLPARHRVALELLHQILGHRSTRLFLAGYIVNVWEYVELRIYPDPFCSLKKFDMMCKKGLDLFLVLHLPKHWQYPQLTMIWWVCALISDVAIIKQFSFLMEIYFSLKYS